MGRGSTLFWEVPHGGDVCLGGHLGKTFSDPDGWFFLSALHEPSFFCGGDTPDLVRLDRTSLMGNIRLREWPEHEYWIPSLPDYTDPVLDFGTISSPTEPSRTTMPMFSIYLSGRCAGLRNRDTPPYTNSDGYLRRIIYASISPPNGPTRFIPVIPGLVKPGGTSNPHRSSGQMSYKSIGEEDRWNDFVIARLFCEEWISQVQGDYESSYCVTTPVTPGGDHLQLLHLGRGNHLGPAHKKGLAEWMATEILKEYPSTVRCLLPMDSSTSSPWTFHRFPRTPTTP